MMNPLLMVGFGGFLGSISRYLIGAALSGQATSGFPLNTLLINLTGSFLIGAFLFLSEARPGSMLFYFIIPGLLGGFTTYSAFSAESFLMIKNELFKEAFYYILVTLLGGFLATTCGYFLGRTMLVFLK